VVRRPGKPGRPPAGLILILELALRVTAERLQRLSDAVAKDVMTRIAPELDARPDRQLGTGEHWSHETRAWKAPASTEFVTLYTCIGDLRELRFSFGAFSDADVKPLPPGLSRLISDVQIIKGLLRFITLREGRVESVKVPTPRVSSMRSRNSRARFGRGDVVGTLTRLLRSSG
jgi:hypothetical protein